MSNSVAKKTWENLTEGLYAIKRKDNNELIGYVKISNPKYCGLGFWRINGEISKLYNGYGGSRLICWSRADYWYLEPIEQELEQVLFG